MKKLEKTWIITLVMAIIGIIVFWIAGICDRMDIAKWSFIGAGISAWVAIISLGLHKLRERNCSYL